MFRWFSPGTPASSTTKTGRHDIAEILLKVAVKTPKINQNQSIVVNFSFWRRKIRTVITNWPVKLPSMDGNFKLQIGLVCFMVFNAILNNISVISRRSVLLVEETGENHRPVANLWQTFSHTVVSSTLATTGVQTHNVSGDRHWLNMEF
jgi:predicted unusual protein kinase regulating ubiquinone biosynthesis (AarF/ABC1/UbiB family)